MGTGTAGSVFGENSFYHETRDTRLGGRHVANHSSDPWVAYPEVKTQVRDLVRVVDIVVPLPHGEMLFYRASWGKWGKWAEETCVGCSQQRQATEEPGKVQGRDCVGIVDGSCL